MLLGKCQDFIRFLRLILKPDRDRLGCALVVSVYALGIDARESVWGAHAEIILFFLGC